MLVLISCVRLFITLLSGFIAQMINSYSSKILLTANILLLLALLVLGMILFLEYKRPDSGLKNH
jgi:hypothetical protein